MAKERVACRTMSKQELCLELVPIFADDLINNDVEDYAIDRMLLNKDDVDAWKELSFHLLIKSICRLGFRKPTPIQKACTPAVAHQGKVFDHLKAATKNIDIRVIPIAGGMSLEKQERLLKRRPENIVGTPGRSWYLMSGENQRLVELHSCLSLCWMRLIG